MADSDDLRAWIGQLSHIDPVERATAAVNVYRRGIASVASIIENLQADAEFRKLASDIRKSVHAQEAIGSLRFVVGIAVEPQNFEMIRAANGSPSLAGVPPDQDAIEFELEFQNHAEVDILTTRDPNGNGAIAKFLKTFGEGIQQVELYVRDVDRATEILRNRLGAQPVYPATRPGANGTRVNFFLVPVADGGKVLLELVEEGS